MNRTHVRSLLISSVALLPLLAATANAEPVPEDAASPSADAGFVLYRPIAEALIQDDTEFETDVIVEPELEPELEREPVPEPEPRDYSVSLQDATRDRSTRTLDWRTPQVEIRFDLSHADITQALSVTLSADPLPGVDATIPLMMQFNGSDPIEIETRGDATNTVIDLDPGRARDTGNVLRVSYATSCKAPVGGYQINLDRSRLDVTALPKGHQLELRDVERRFSSLTFAPKTVGLISNGDMATKGQALAAQGVGLRTDKIPTFLTSPRQSDFDIIMLTRSDLLEFTQDDAVLLSAGPLIALSSTHSNRLFLTGDTEAEVLEAVSAFATASLPDSRLSMTTPDIVFAQSPLDVDRRLVDGSANLDVLTVQTGTQRDYVFDVTDPAASEGDLVLRLNRDEQTQAGTRLKASLNGVDLGETAVRGRRKTVSYPIQKGLLLGTRNRLELTTQDANNRPRCGASVPFIAISEGSELRLNAALPTLPSDLSRFAANGSLFGQDAGAKTVMVLPVETADFTSALTVVAKLARASGRGWIDAEFARGHTELTDKHTLIIEPHSEIDREFRIDAPLALQSAWRGQNPDVDDSQFVEKFASLDGESAVRQAAFTLRSANATHSGGVAAIFPVDGGRLVGVISNTADSDFATAIQPLANDLHWNGLKGGVTRWDEQDVILAQAALPMPIIEPVTETIEPTIVSLSLGDHAKGLAANLPELRLPKPQTEALTNWIDSRWTQFSTARQSKTLTVEPYKADTVTTPQLETISENTFEAVQRPAITLPHSLSPALVQPAASGLQGRVEGFGNVAAGLRADLWRHLDIPEQDMKSARLGQAQIIPAALTLIVLFLMFLVGLTFATPPANKPHRR